MKCQNEQKVGMKYPFNVEPCTAKATRRRKGWRFGDKSKGEPAIIDTITHLCDECAISWDEAKREARWEARAS